MGSEFLKFDKNGCHWKSLKYREKFSIREFAEYLADCDKGNIPRFDDESWDEYNRNVNPWIQVLIDGLRVEEIPTEDDDIPF